MKKASACCIFATELFHPSLLHGSTHLPCDWENTDKRWHSYSRSERRPAPCHRLSSKRKGPIQCSFTHRRPHLLKRTVKLQPEHSAIYRTAIIWGPKGSKIQIFLIDVTKTSRCGLGKKIPDFAFVQCSDMSTTPFLISELLHKWFLQDSF